MRGVRAVAFWVLVGILVFAGVSAWGADGVIWVEAESAAKLQLVDNPGLNAVSPSALSGGKWICSFANEGQETGSAAYDVAVAQAGQYHLWVRAGLGSGLSCTVDQGAQPLVADAKKGVDPVPIAANGNSQYPPSAKWFDLGALDLAAGKHSFVWSLGGTEGKERFAGIDCFVLAAAEFRPNGKYQPGEQAPAPAPDFDPAKAWAFQPSADTLDAAALIDLRSLNEKTAGEHGFIKLSADGNSFVRGDGEPIRFWAAGERTNDRPKLEEMQHQAQFLAKRGVNIMRIFAMLPSTAKDSKLGDVNEKELDCVFKVVAAMKSAGIYTIVDGYWAVQTKLQAGWDVTNPGRGESEGLVFFDPKFQAGYKAWMKALLDRPNPYTNVRLADDPAVAIIQLQNEDSLIWWGFAGLKGDALTLLRGQYAEFLQKKYGALDKAKTAWQGYGPQDPAKEVLDEWDKNLPGFLNVWDFTREAWAKKGAAAGFKERSADQLEFLATTMRKFNADMADYLRKELGCKQLINANNWRTVDLVTTQDAEYWADSANDVIARNIYTGGVHQGVNNGWQILAGHVYSDASMIRDPRHMPTNVKQVEGHPFMLPEVLWCPPNLYQSEAALMVAAQNSLTGLALTCWFSNYAAEWEQNPMIKWTYSTPMQIGQFPAAALLYRKGYVKQGEPAVVEQRSLRDMWDRRTPLISEEPGWDPNRDKDNLPATSSVKTAADPLAYFVGPVRVVYGGDPAKSRVADLAKYIDQNAKTARSITGETELDWGKGVYRVNAPKAQGAAGFLGAAGVQKLADVEIASKNRYATIVAVALDDKPLKESGRILVQVGTLARPEGWTSLPTQVQQGDGWADAARVVSTGKAPWLVEKTDATVTIANAALSKAASLDCNGMVTAAPVDIKHDGGKTVLTLPPDTMYVVLGDGK